MTAEGWILVKSAEGTRGTPTRRPAPAAEQVAAQRNRMPPGRASRGLKNNRRKSNNHNKIVKNQNPYPVV
jgi:hypothetical protein